MKNRKKLFFIDVHANSDHATKYFFQDNYVGHLKKDQDIDIIDREEWKPLNYQRSLCITITRLGRKKKL